MCILQITNSIVDRDGRLLFSHTHLSTAEAINLAALLCQFGYLFAVDQSIPCCSIRDDSALYRFQVRTHIRIYSTCSALLLVPGQE